MSYLPNQRKLAMQAFHGKPPRLFFRLLDGHPAAWGKAARTPRQDVLRALAAVGLTVKLVTRTLHTGYQFNVGDLVSQ
jgi:hypothetical protein